MDLVEIDKRYTKLLDNIEENMMKLKKTKNLEEKEKIKANIDRDLFFMNFLSIEAKPFDKNISEDIQKTYKTYQQTMYTPNKQTNLKCIENDIKTINNIFKDIHTLVYQQSEKLNSIEDNIIVTQNKIEKAEDELNNVGTSIKTKVYTLLFLSVATITGISLLK